MVCLVYENLPFHRDTEPEKEKPLNDVHHIFEIAEIVVETDDDVQNIEDFNKSEDDVLFIEAGEKLDMNKIKPNNSRLQLTITPS